MFPERIHADIEPRLVCKFCEIWMTGNKQTRALITGQKNFRWLARSRFFADRVQNLSGPAPDNDVHATSYNSAGSIRIRMKFGVLRVYCLELALTDFGRGPLTAEIDWPVWAPQQISTGFASCLRYFRDLINNIQQRAPRTFG